MCVRRVMFFTIGKCATSEKYKKKDSGYYTIKYAEAGYKYLSGSF
jgi:hypothetical protein